MAKLSNYRHHDLSETLAKKEAEMAGMEERYKKYIEKAKSVIKTLDPKQNPSGAPEVSALKNQRQDKNQTLINIGRSAHYYLEEAERERNRLAQELLEVRAGNETLVSNLSNSRCSRLYNPKGSQSSTMVYSKMLEDAAVRPNEYSVWCEQCTNHHPVHNQDDMLIIFVTEDRELSKGTKSHMGGLRDTTFRDRLAKGGISHSQVIHIKFVDVRDGRAFADNLTWLTALIARECNCQCFVFWNVGTSFLLSGGSVGKLFNINKVAEDVANNMGVLIRNTSLNLKHKFVLVPLAYNQETCVRD